MSVKANDWDLNNLNFKLLFKLECVFFFAYTRSQVIYIMTSSISKFGVALKGVFNSFTHINLIFRSKPTFVEIKF